MVYDTRKGGVDVEGKNSFLMYQDYEPLFLRLSHRQAGLVVKALFAFLRGEQVEGLSPQGEMLFAVICQQLERNAKNYAETCRINQENGRKGGRPRKTAEIQASASEEKRETQKPEKTEKTGITQGFFRKPLKDKENDKEKDKDKEREGISPSPSSHTALEGFDRFWAAYPKKAAREQAAAVWQHLLPDAQLQKKILQGLTLAKTQPQWTEDGGKFIPYAGNWLKDRRWEDGVEEGCDSSFSPGSDMGEDREKAAFAAISFVPPDDFWEQ
jgi:hypothetical protein